MLTIPEQHGLSGRGCRGPDCCRRTGRGEPGRPAERTLRVQRAVVDQLDTLDALRPSLDAREATDILWTLNHPTLWHLLVRERDWAPPRLLDVVANRQLRGI
jgi:hypothetical protein